MIAAFASIHLVAILTAVIANTIVGMVWYSPGVFGGMWMSLVGLTPEKIKKSGGPGRAIAISVLMSVLTALTLSVLFVLVDVRTVLEGMVVSSLLAVGLLGTIHVTHGVFEMRSFRLLCLSAAHDFVSLLAMGVILALWR